MNKFILFIGGLTILVLVGGGLFVYLTRPVLPPSENSEVPPPVPQIGEVVYRIDPSRSRVEFKVNEVLRGASFTAIGTTSEISGDIVLLAASPTNETYRGLTAGNFQVNARTFKTDDQRRDAAIARFILKSEDPANEFIVFTFRQAVGLPKDWPAGKEIDFRLEGELSIAGVTKPVSWNVKGKVDETTIGATAETIIRRADFNLQIPSVSFVASVADEVLLSINLTAERIR